MNYHDFLDEYCGRVEQDGTDNRKALWFLVDQKDELGSSEYLDVFVQKTFHQLESHEFKKITILRELSLEDRISTENELNKLLGFKQYD